MTQIYLAKIDVALDQKKIDALIQLISEENQEKCRRFKKKADVLRTLYGELMVRYFLWKQFSLADEDVEFLKGENGKPYIKGLPVHYSISHAGDFVVCAFCEKEIGIDIEKIRTIDLKVGKRFFCDSEYEDLLMKKKLDQIDYFFTLWTLKESYIKWLGTGMLTPLDSFCFSMSQVGISFMDKKREVKPFFKQYFVAGYKLAVCSVDCDFPDEMENLALEEMIVFKQGLL